MMLQLKARHILTIFHIIYLIFVPLHFLISQTQFCIIFMFTTDERLFVIPEMVFKYCFTGAKVIFQFVSSDFTVNADSINYVFHLATNWQGTSIYSHTCSYQSLLHQVCCLELYDNPYKCKNSYQAYKKKKKVYVVCYEEENADLKNVRII